MFAYAVGSAHPLKEPCQRLLTLAGAGAVELHASVEMIQELLFHRLRMTDRQNAVAQARRAAAACVLHDFDTLTLSRALELTAAHDRIGGRDAVHAATALQRGLSTVLTPDRAFDGIDGLRRVGPAELVAELTS